MSWPDAAIAVTLTRKAVKDAPPDDPSVPMGRHREMGLHQHHGRAGYWAEEVKLEQPQSRTQEKRQICDQAKSPCGASPY